MDIGSKIKELRTEKNITQDELGRLSGLAQKTISNIEINKNTPSLTTLNKIANALSVDVGEITGITEARYEMNLLTDLISNLYNNNLISSEEIPDSIQRLIIDTIKTQLKVIASK